MRSCRILFAFLASTLLNGEYDRTYANTTGSSADNDYDNGGTTVDPRIVTDTYVLMPGANQSRHTNFTLLDESESKKIILELWATTEYPEGAASVSGAHASSHRRRQLQDHGSSAADTSGGHGSAAPEAGHDSSTGNGHGGAIYSLNGAIYLINQGIYLSLIHI